MKALLIVIPFLFIACTKEKPVVVEPPKPVEKPAYCSPEGAKFSCGNPVWYNEKECIADTDGDGKGEGTMYMQSLEDIKKLSEKSGVSIKVKMKDGSVAQFGVGFAAPCEEL